MRTFRVVSVLNPQDFTNSFSVHGALRHPYKGEKYRSLKAAEHVAKRAIGYAYVVRRTAQGWVRVACWSDVGSVPEVAPHVVADMLEAQDVAAAGFWAYPSAEWQNGFQANWLEAHGWARTVRCEGCTYGE